MRAISLFSGAGGFELGFDRAGIETLVQVEKDPWCLEVLARHWPHTLRVTDVEHLGLLLASRREQRSGYDGGWVATDHTREDTGPFDVVYGGWPCQDLSVAGNRAGLRGERSGLFHELVRVVRELRPRWIAAENVLGLLSNADGRDFAIVLSSLVECGYGVAWRVLDGRYFGVPQRRRRVLIVGCLGDAARAAQVLAVCESCGGHPAPRRTPRQDTAYSLAASARGTGDGHGNAWNTTYVNAAPLTAGGHSNGVNMPGRHKEDDENLVVARGLTARESGYRMDFETENFLVASPDRASDGHHGYSSGRGDGADNLIAFDWQASAGNDQSWRGKGRQHVVRSGDYAGATSATRVDAVSYSAGVRRLTPLECERLMAWPDEHTRWTSDGREISDAHRYRMCGNGVIATMAEWLGHRLVTANAWST